MDDERLRGLFERLHGIPELALHELETTRLIRDELAGIEGVEFLDLGLETGVLARIAGTRADDAVALRADIDALPVPEQSGLPYASANGRMHACGHDFHTTALLGAARELASRRGELEGTVYLLFQPAEEASDGGRRVVEAGALQKLGIRCFFGLHVDPALPVGVVSIPDGALSASVDRFALTVRGRGAHAASPQLGRDPIVAAARLVGDLQEVVSRAVGPFEPAVLSVTRIQGGSTWNVIPEDVEIEGTARTMSPAVRDVVENEVRRRVGALGAEGYETGVEWHRSCAPVINEPELAREARQIARNVGIELGELRPSMGGEDFSELYAAAPGVFAHVGVDCAYPLHNPRFVASEDALPVAARLHVAWALETLRHQ